MQKKALAKQQADFAIKKRIVENDSDWEIDWNDENQSKWTTIYYDNEHKKICYVVVNYRQDVNNYYFSSEEKAEKCIKDCKQHLDILFDV